ncbi:MAG: hydantoinase B/oxoprolinase family protein [Chloroflexi bacterium]|nr:hydantoinase B/oxoprolinase family protein [Chloroflexota bacterium]
MKTDPILVEIFANKFQSIAEEMANVVRRTAATIFVVETADFSTCLATPRGEFFGCPIRLGITTVVTLDISDFIKAIDHYDEGDVVVTNDPYTTGAAATQLTDVTMIKPVFWDGRIVCFLFGFAHATDVGGKVPGSISPSNYEVFQEGIRVPPTKLYRTGELNREFLNLFLANCRVPDDNWGDMKAIVSALNTGERRMHEMITRYGLKTIEQGMEDVLEYAELKTRAAIADIPDGTYEFSDYLDDDIVSNIPLRLSLRMTVKGDEMRLDWRDSDPQVRAAFNIPTGGKRHPWITYRVSAYVYTTMKGVPFNAGLARPISVELPEASVVNPKFPVAFGVRFPTALRASDVITGALARALPNKMPAAGAGNMAPLLLSEPDFATGRRKVLTIQVMLGGTGGSPAADGVDGRNGELGTLFNTPIESVERNASIVVREYGVRPDSGGPGRFRGGHGIVLEFKVVKPGSLITARGQERYRFQPWGASGGKCGANGKTILNPGTPHEEDIGRIDALPLKPGDVVRLLTAGGGGWGNPFERDPEAVLKDVRDGFVTLEAAERDYGVAFVEGKINWEGTTRLRTTSPDAIAERDFDFGKARREYEAIWAPDVRGTLNDILYSLPVDARDYVRLEIVGRINRLAAEQPIRAPDVHEAWRELQQRLAIQ